MKSVHVLSFILGLFAIGAVLLDAFETMILPRRASGKIRLTRLFYIGTWIPWRAVTSRIQNVRTRETAYSFYGPLSLLLLIAIWAYGLVLGFGFLYYGLGASLHDVVALHGMWSCIYFSGTTLFTLGLGDVVPLNHWVRNLVVIEAGTGLGFVAVVIGYLPVLYGSFSRREVTIALLDARAGSPPNAAELLRRHAFDGGAKELSLLMAEWERWAAELLESHISYPFLCYFRSQHDNQSWLSALTAMLDTTALLLSVVESGSPRQAHLTFAMARHAVVDLLKVFGLPAPPCKMERLSDDGLRELCAALEEAGYHLTLEAPHPALLRKLRWMYEGQVAALSEFLCMPMPPFLSGGERRDTWRLVGNLLELYSSPTEEPPDYKAEKTRELFTEESHPF
jgi:Ion channel